MTAVEAFPQPQAIDAAVWVDGVARTLTVRLRDRAGGYERLLWTQAWQAMRRSEENGWPEDGAPWVFCDVPGARQVVHGVPGEGGTLQFHFPVGTRGFAELVSRPGVTAIVTVDRSRLTFLSCRFFNQRLG